MARQFQFVTVSNPGESASSESRKSNHSHVMRQVHAKKRRLQIQMFRNESSCGRRQDLVTLNLVISGLPSEPQAPTYGKDPFSSLARPLASEEFFLLDYYIKVVMPYTIGHCGLFESSGIHRTELLQEWVGLAVADNVLMVAAVLLSTCRYILLLQPDHPVFTRMALHYKQICLNTLRQEIGIESSRVSTMTVAKAVALAIDEIISGEHGIARTHLQGVLAMIQSNGGPESFRLSGLLERMYHRFTILLGLKDATADISVHAAGTQNLEAHRSSSCHVTTLALAANPIEMESVA